MQHPLPPAITPDSAAPALQSRVDAAAFALLREGRNPTVALVRERIGGASPNAVGPALQRWRLTFAAQLDENAGSALDVLPPGVLEIVQALWSRALFEAHRVREDARSTADALEQLDALTTQLRGQLATLQSREAALEAERRALERERRKLETRRPSPSKRPTTNLTLRKAKTSRARSRPGVRRARSR